MAHSSNRHDITTKIIHFWFVNNCSSDKSFPAELYQEIAKHYHIIKVLDFICDSDELETLTQTAEKMERYDEMMKFITALVEIKCGSFQSKHSYIKCSDEMCELLTVNQRNLLSNAYKMVLIGKRSSLRKLSKEIHTFANDTDGDKKSHVLQGYKKIIELEIEQICHKLLDLVELHIMKSIKQCTASSMESAEAFVFYMKLAADWNRDLAELFTDTVEYKEKARVYYKDAMKLARDKLPTTNVILLEVSLNCCIYLADVAKKPMKARLIAKRAFDEAINELDSVPDCDYKEVTLIMQLLRDNLSLWIAESEEDLDEW